MTKFLTLLISLTIFASSSLFADWVVPASSLPQKSRAFIQKVYPNAQIWKVERDGGKFEVKLSNGASIDFLANGNWQSIDGEYNGVPFSALPAAISSTIKKTYPQAMVIDVEKEWGNYKVKLNNMMELFISSNGQLFERLTSVEYKLLEHDKKFDQVFEQLQHEENIKQKIFFEGQIYDAYSLIIDIIKKANKKILIIDNYIDESVLKMLTKKNKEVEVAILTSDKSKIEKIDIQKFNKEYPILKVAKTNKFHDRFIVIDNKEMYDLGASIKDLGRKCFGINKIEDLDIVERFINLQN